jgi:hypothetical protein
MLLPPPLLLLLLLPVLLLLLQCQGLQHRDCLPHVLLIHVQQLRKVSGNEQPDQPDLPGQVTASRRLVTFFMLADVCLGVYCFNAL